MKSVKELQLENRIHWRGYLDDKEVSTYLYACQMIVMPYKDGASLRRGTLMAALAHGRPIITTKPRTAVEELNHGENVWMTPVDDPAAIAAGVIHLASDDRLRKNLGLKAADMSEQFGWSRIASQTREFYKKVINS